MFSAFLVCFASEFQCSCSIHLLIYVCIPYCHKLLSFGVDYFPHIGTHAIVDMRSQGGLLLEDLMKIE